MTYYIIPEGSVEIQPGLWAHLKPFSVGGETYNFYNIYSGDGYCFWDINQPENYDEEGNLKPLEQREFARMMYTAYKMVEDINANIFSVPIQPGYNVNDGSDPEVAL